MNSRWDDREAAQATGDLAQRVYTARLLGKEKTLVLPGSGSVSWKTVEKDLFGEDRDVLYVSGQGADLATIEKADFSPLRLDSLKRLATLGELPDALLAKELAARLIDHSAPVPPLEALLHAILPHEYVDYVPADALLAISNTPSGPDHIQRIYGHTVAIVAYARPGLASAKLLAEAIDLEVNQDTLGIVLLKQGLISFGETAQIAYQRLIDLVSRAEEYLLERGARYVSTPYPAATGALPDADLGPPKGHVLAGLRQAASAVAGFPVIMRTHGDEQCLSFARRDNLAALTQRGPATPRHALISKRLPQLGRDVAAFRAAYEQYCAAHAAGALPVRRDLAPRVILDPELGMCTVGRSAGEAALVADIYRHTMEIILGAEALEEYRPASAQDVFDVEYADLEVDRISPGATGDPAGRPGHTPGQSTGQPGARALPVFAGQVALVTGAASGIGRACIASFLARGAAAVGLDINPEIVGLYDRADYLGLQGDVADEEAVRAALETTVRAFGGLDMLVLNAGVFPSSCRIESLHLGECDRVMQVNLDANILLLREAYPLLKVAPAGGRVVINGSKNVLAPGPGAAAYSISKAALTQLARVAAMEWGQDNIRVNVIHAHAVFDTGIWTEEVLCARAKHYQMTVEEYKTNNILRVEITSHDVAELVAELCGPLFAKTTGAQIPIDGGSDRVI